MSYIELNRKFSQLSSNNDSNISNTDYSLRISSGGLLTWQDLLAQYNRCVILAEAGAGKTKEFEEQAKKLEKANKFSFFIRIEDIDNDFIESFEVGNEDAFVRWLSSTDEAWFFLDSVDEARLEDPRAFQKAIKKFKSKIQTASHRCHIYISSRPYSWRYQEDEKFLDSIIPDSSNENNEVSSNSTNEASNNNEKSTIKVVTLSPLGYEEIEQFCNIRRVANISDLIYEIKRFDLLGLAERPFDLENIINKWNNEGKLGSRLEILNYNIEQRLRDSHTQDRRSIPISFEKLIIGAERLAAAVLLTFKANIGVPLSQQNTDTLNASSLLCDWTDDEICRLLESGIFNDIIYGAVRFRHRDIREFLAAKWFAKQLNGDNRLAVENLLFKNQFGENIITPSLRVILPWLILLDDKICQKVVKFQPELAFESGDPSQLPSSIRKQFFSEYVHRIANNLDDHSIRDNDSISKIVNSDLEDDVLSLIAKYFENKEVIFFLGRMVWQAKFNKCIPLLISIALDPSRDIYSRRVSIRAIMSCSTKIEKFEFWTKLNKNEEILNRQLIVELIGEIEPDQDIIKLLICSLKNVYDYKKHVYTGLSAELEEFVKKCDEKLEYQLLVGIDELLRTEPFYENKEYRISKKYAWLVKVVYRIIENLVERRSHLVFENITLELLINSTALEYYSEYSVKNERNKLESLIPDWVELNDKLYWHTIALARQYEKQQITDDWRISYLDHFWKFSIKDFDRLLGFIDSKELNDDKLIALNRIFIIYHQNNKPEWMLIRIKSVCSTYPALLTYLKSILNPIQKNIPTECDLKLKKLEKKYKKEKLKETKARLDWIESLKNNPDQITKSSHILKGELTNNHIWLMNELEVKRDSSNHYSYYNWQDLIPDLGKEVAYAYRDAAIQFWRVYKPQLHSETILEKNSTPYNLVFGLSGLEIEYNEDPNFFNKLSMDEIKNALRYISWEINGFPLWFEKSYQFFPDKVIDAVTQEIIWELESSDPTVNQPYNHILHDLLYHAPWLHIDISYRIFKWLRENSKLLHKDTCRYALQILLNSNITKEDFSSLAQQKIEESNLLEQKAWWYALYVDSNPSEGLTSFTIWLESLSQENASQASQIFICHLIGKRDSINGKAGDNQFKEVRYLKWLYSLMCKYIKIEEDINRRGSGVYSPEIRDNAQEARDLIFTYLKEVPCAQSYYAIKDLSNEMINHNRQNWFLKTAYNIALSCGDLEPWESEQFLQFETSGNIEPKTHKELFDLALLRIIELKDWLENGDDSAWRTWQRVEEETEMRNLIASELRKKAQNKYSVSQENELANSQRTDIRLENPRINSPVPIELKILDKNWTGPDLCERLRNQLVGDYLREATSGCGVFLLVAQNTNKKWFINGSRVALNELEENLQNYWYGIASQWPTIDSIKVIVIDLNKRGLVCNT
ncbi:hypothetical protein BDGL_001291 [Acinetobacter pittii PHEA-2]|uniref:Uncharacterized protein n=1 Tax=Acinetobacter pittii (strain PHEA-2) TaxID=871585 RepID=F0KF09_ACIP2|nr:hypothetical protein [Acinetobacter pittii]YP_004995559.1 hypothetical protein BDGL_001291 [Acinetobacter pittii PHEA-2]ADY81877.1 hypothetical protein BDGL_001291 [Acinetobacter pittii PHEA-2]